MVARDAEIASHKKVFYYKVKGKLRLQNGALIDVEYIPDENDPNLTDGKILQRPYAEKILSSLSELRGTAHIEKVPVVSKPPMPFNLVALQSFCSKKFGYQPDATLAITQSLRDKYKAITYNRTDCQYLSDEHFAEAPKTTAVTMQNLGITIPELNCSIKSRCFNSSKIKTHFAIIPSGQAVNLNAMTAQERNVYTAIAQFYLAQFMPNAKKERTTLEMPLDIGGMLRATSTEVKSPGFLALDMLGTFDEEEPPSVLSRVPAGDYYATLEAAEVKDCETKPKPKYTPATLIVDMTRIARYVEDPFIKEVLIRKDEGDDSVNGSIGTDATRTIIVNDLLKQGYCEMQGKYIVSTAKGREFYRILPDEFKKADLTAKWWLMQEDIKAGAKTIQDMTSSVIDAIQCVLMQDFPRLNAVEFGIKEGETIGKCPLCGGGLIQESKNGYYCTENDPKGINCQFFIPKETNVGIMSRTPVTPAMVRKLIAGKPVFVKTLWTKKKTEPGQKEEYQLSPGKLTLNTDPASKFLIGVSFEREPLGTCPKCKTGNVLEGKFAFGCSNYNANPPCDFRVSKDPNPEHPESFRSHLKITKTMMKQLLAGKTVSNVTLWSQSKQREYMGEIGLKTEENGDVHIAPVFRDYGDMVGVCPRCGGTVTESRYGYKCSNYENGCRYQLWKTAKSGLLSKATITADIAQKLILGEKVSMPGLWSEKNKKKFTGTIYLDDSKRGEYGPDIKLVPFTK